MHICFCTCTKYPYIFPSNTDDSNVLFHHPSIHSRSLDGAFDTSARNCMDCYNRLLWWQCCMQAHKICSDDWSLFKVIMIISVYEPGKQFFIDYKYIKTQQKIPTSYSTFSSYVLVMTAIDRYQAICNPLSNCSWTPKRSHIMIAVAWTISLLLCIPQTIIFSTNKDEHHCGAVSNTLYYIRYV